MITSADTAAVVVITTSLSLRPSTQEMEALTFWETQEAMEAPILSEALAAKEMQTSTLDEHREERRIWQC